MGVVARARPHRHRHGGPMDRWAVQCRARRAEVGPAHADRAAPGLARRAVVVAAARWRNRRPELGGPARRAHRHQRPGFGRAARATAKPAPAAGLDTGRRAHRRVAHRRPAPPDRHPAQCRPGHARRRRAPRQRTGFHLGPGAGAGPRHPGQRRTLCRRCASRCAFTRGQQSAVASTRHSARPAGHAGLAGPARQ